MCVCVCVFVCLYVFVCACVLCHVYLCYSNTLFYKLD